MDMKQAKKAKAEKAITIGTPTCDGCHQEVCECRCMECDRRLASCRCDEEEQEVDYCWDCGRETSCGPNTLCNECQERRWDRE